MFQLIKKLNIENLSSVILFILGFVLVIDTILYQFFSIGSKQEYLILGYCISFVFLSIKFPNLIKKKAVIIPMYIMIIQMLYSLILTFIIL